MSILETDRSDHGKQPRGVFASRVRWVLAIVLCTTAAAALLRTPAPVRVAVPAVAALPVVPSAPAVYTYAAPNPAPAIPDARVPDAVDDLAVPPTVRPRVRLAAIPGDGPAMRGTRVLKTRRLDIYVGKNTLTAEDVQAIGPLLEALLIENEQGLGTFIKRRISVGFYNPAFAPSRGTRGIAYTDEGRIELFYRPGEDPRAAATIAAHELGHHLEYARYGRDVQQRADIILHEGGATWIAGVRWLDKYDARSWRERAFQLASSGVPLRLIGAQRSGSDVSYELWGSFVSYIYKYYGIGTLDELYRSSRGRAAGSADYLGITGKTLAELTTDWRAWVLAYTEPTPTPVPMRPTVTPMR